MIPATEIHAVAADLSLDSQIVEKDYDVINLFRHGEFRPAVSTLMEVLRTKCEFKKTPVPTLAGLSGRTAELTADWEAMLGHQLPVLPPFESFWDALPEFFQWLEGATLTAQPSVPVRLASRCCGRLSVTSGSNESRARRLWRRSALPAPTALEDDIRLDPQMARLRRDVLAARERAERQSALAAEATRRAARVLTGDLRLGVRDAGHLLGVSHQRIHQLLAE